MFGGELLAQEFADDAVVDLEVFFNEEFAGLRFDLKCELFLEFYRVEDELLQEGVCAVVVENVACDQI